MSNPLNELNKSTLRRYIKKAALSLDGQAFRAGQSAERQSNAKNSSDRKPHTDDYNKANRKAHRRVLGIGTAAEKLNPRKKIKLEESLTSQAAVRKHFWDNHPHLDKKKIKDYSGKGKMHTTDTRTAFADHVDSLHRDGHISDKLANSVTLGEDTMPTINPFIIATVNNHPHEAREILSQQMSEKISDALATAKIDYAQNLFGTPQIQEEVEPLDEQMTRKHFQMVADTIKAHPDAKKRNELAAHHAEIFKKDNPRFDHKRFYAAAGATLKEEVEPLEEVFVVSGKRFPSLEAAKAHAASIYKKTRAIVAIEKSLKEETVVQKDEKNGVKYIHYGRGTKGPFLTVSKKIKKK